MPKPFSLLQRRAKLLASLTVAICLGSPHAATAQQPDDARAAVFAQLLQDPANPDLMLDYARLSVEARDFEAAVSTLERLVDLDPTAKEARFDLAVAYFALGANEVARHHLDIYRAAGDLTPEEAAEARRYADAIDRRTAPVSFSGYVEGGGAYLSDPGALGFALAAGVTNEIDLGDANQTIWLTRARASLLRFPNSSDDHQMSAVLNTGPAFRITRENFGPTLRPFAELSHIETDDDDVQRYGLGLAYQNPVSATFSVFASATAGGFDRDPVSDGLFVLGEIGGSYRPTDATAFWAGFRALTEDADGAGEDRDRIGGWVSVRHSFAPGIVHSARDWIVEGFANVDFEDRTGGREDTLTGIGGSLRAYLSEAHYAELGVRVFDRDSTLDRFDNGQNKVTLTVGMEF